MIPASRTPEGYNARCPVCGNDITLEPSIPPGDAPCPICGSLVWFDTRQPPPASREEIAATREQIRTIVREISVLSATNLSPPDYYEQFLFLTLQALAAVGGAVWMLERPRPWPLRWFHRRRLQLINKLNVSDQFLYSDLADAQSHQRLLDHAISTDTEQLAPPHSAAKDYRIGGNPTNHLLVLSPLRNKNSIVGVVEIFQRPDSPAPTQRGYLQFLKQMCEISSGYLERQQLA